MKNTFYYNTKIGEIAIEENGVAITRLYFVNKDLEKEVEIKEETWLMRKAIKEIKEYLEGKRNSFDLPLEPEGTEFQKKVWNVLKEIPYGETRSYGEIAKLNAFIADILGCDVENVYESLEDLLNILIPKKALHEYGVTEQDLVEFTDSVMTNQGRLMANNFVELDRDRVYKIYKELF